MPKKNLDDDYDQQQKQYEVYLAERNRLLNLMVEGNRSIDNAVLTLTAGAFGLSITFMKTITTNIYPKTLWILIGSWICFGFSLCLTLFSFYTSKCASKKQIEILETNYFPEDCQENCDESNLKNYWNYTTKILNISSIFIFILGIIFLTIFSGININKEVNSLTPKSKTAITCNCNKKTQSNFHISSLKK